MDSARTAPARKHDLPVLAGTLALSSSLFVIDALTPLGYSIWIFQAWAVALAIFQTRPRLPWLLAALATTYTAAGVTLSPEGANVSMNLVLFNRTAGSTSFFVIGFIVSLVISQREAAQRNLWLQQTESQLAQALAGDLLPAEIGARSCDVLCARLDARVGVLYTVQGERLLPVGSHGLDATSQVRTLGLHDGLLGQACRDGRFRALSPAPEGHLPVQTGLGRSEPSHILILPLQIEGRVLGVIELGLQRRELDLTPLAGLASQIAEVVGLALRGAMYREERQSMLAEAQQQAEVLQAQQEELRVSNEELEEQGRVLRESQAALEVQQTELERVNQQIASYAASLEQRQAELLRSQAELSEKSTALETASRYKSEFLANMSHELRTPLNSSLILSRLLMENGGQRLNEDEVRFATAIHDSNNDLLLLINDILDLSRIEAGHVELAAEAVNLAELASRMEAVVDPLAREKGLAFRVHFEPGTPDTLETDKQRLQQVLKNLLSNAVKFTAAGQIELSLRPLADGGVGFDVTDTGMGIPAEKHEIIFEAFRQADGSTNRLFGGTGLGLSISRELVVRMGGSIRLRSEPGRGSTFTVELPAHLPETPVAAALLRKPAAPPASLRPGLPAAAPAPAPPAPPAPRRPKSGRRLVLAVDDDSEFVQVLQQLVEEMDFDCLVAGNGSEALALAREYAPAGVLLDVGLPDVSGLSVLERLKHDPATRHIPVHLVSAVDRSQTALAMGAIGHVVKPARREELVAAIARLRERADQALRRVLVVEDDPQLRENLQHLLAGPNTEIVTVGSAAAALDALADRAFDCMVTDLALPDASGFDLLERMAANPAQGFPPVIVYTGRQLSRDEETRLRRYSRSIIVKGARSPERLLDEVTLFLHSVEANLPPEQQRLLQSARKRDSTLEDRRILLAEDDVRNIFALTSVFEPLGASLEIARNGREALDRLDRDPPIDLVLMDVMMPEMDGITAIRQLRARPGHADIPVIAITAKAMADDRRQCLEAGANDYLAKPIDVDRLVSLCRVWMPR
ncbi:response regulator [Uliginosibacterium paludis]|uniref:histidine kinase n=1 Tax=Uliginosibacterium paludis TaxID=1615952 RepID=A0ABV2CW02_9RHOO